MNVTLSYSGGTSRGEQLARAFDARGQLARFFVPSWNREVDLLPKSLLGGRVQSGIDLSKVRTNLLIRGLTTVLQKTARLRSASPTERYWRCEAIDRWVANSLPARSDILIAEAQIALHTLRRAKRRGMLAVLDRTNTHIAYQSRIWREENARFGITWEPNSARVIARGIEEYDAADYILTLSSFCKRTFIEHGVPAEKVICVPSGIDLKEFPEHTKDDDTFRIIFCGAIIARKGCQYLIEAFKQLRIPNAELLLIGSLFDEIKPMMAHDGIRHVPHVDRGQLFRYYAQGDVFVMPSLEEGLPKVLLEAMACGLPAIATPNAGAEDVIREGVDGFVVPIRDAEALAERLAWMYENPSRRAEMGRNARARARAEFSLERYTERLTAALAAMLAARGH